MRRAGIGMYLVMAAVAACGGKVAVDLGTGLGGAGVAGSGGAPVSACPAVPIDGDIKNLLGQPCAMEGESCASNNGCGGCSIQCVDGTWTQTSANLCFSIGNSC